MDNEVYLKHKTYRPPRQPPNRTSVLPRVFGISLQEQLDCQGPKPPTPYPIAHCRLPHDSTHHPHPHLVEVTASSCSLPCLLLGHQKAPLWLYPTSQHILSLTQHCSPCRQTSLLSFRSSFPLRCPASSLLYSSIMLTRRLLTPLSSPISLLSRTFTTSLSHQKTPSLADITPNGAAAFDARQKEYRERTKAAHKAKEQQDSQFVKTSSSSAPSSSTSTHATPASSMNSSASRPYASNAHDQGDGGLMSDVASKMALGSLSTNDTGAAREASYKTESSKRKGALSSLIYGTKEGQQMDQEIEKSFSQVLARGKYVHSIVFHKVKPDKVDEYVKLVGGWYPRMASLEENHVHLVGSWRTEVGDCDTFGMWYNTFHHVNGPMYWNKWLTLIDSSHLGIPALPRLPRLTPLHSIPP